MVFGRSIGTGFLKNDYVLRVKLDLEKFFKQVLKKFSRQVKRK